MNRNQLSITDVIKFTGCNRANIGYWRRLQLLLPEFSNNGKNKRVFSFNDMFFIAIIQKLKALGAFSSAPVLINYLHNILTGYIGQDFIERLSTENWLLVLEDDNICYLLDEIKNIRSKEIAIREKQMYMRKGYDWDVKLIINLSKIAYDIKQRRDENGREKK